MPDININSKKTQNQAHSYQAFGLIIRSEIEFFQLQPASLIKDADVNIIFGEVAADGIEGYDAPNHHCQAKDNKMWLNIQHVARFLITNGNTIIIDSEPDVDLQTIKLYILGSCMGALLQQRGYLVLHGNAVEINGKAIIVVADSGVGKSTLAAEFFRRGYKLLADDVCAIDDHGMVQPSYPYLKLWQHALDNLELESRKTIKIRAQKEKFYYPLFDSFYQQPLDISRIYILRTHEHEKFVASVVKGTNKMNAFFRNSYRSVYARKMGLTNLYITKFLSLFHDIEITRIFRPETGFKLKELADFLIEDSNRRQQ